MSRFGIALFVIYSLFFAPFISTHAEMVYPLDGNFMPNYLTYQKICPIGSPNDCGDIDQQIFHQLRNSSVPDVATAEKIAKAFLVKNPVPELEKGYDFTTTLREVQSRGGISRLTKTNDLYWNLIVTTPLPSDGATDYKRIILTQVWVDQDGSAKFAALD